MADTDRTEPATPNRRQEARQKGQIAKSIEVNTAFVLLGSFLALRYLSGYIFELLTKLMRTSFENLGRVSFTEEGMYRYGLDMVFNFALMVLPFILVVAVLAVVANLIQVGFLHSWQVLRPQISRINPVSGLKRMFSPRLFADLLKSILKIAIASSIGYIIIKPEIVRIMLTVDMTPAQSIQLVSQAALNIGLKVSLGLGALAVLDYFYQRWQYEKSLKMTRQEVKDELMRYEGRPEVRQRVRALQRQMAMRRMMQDVPKADVVITNPTTYAVAVQYNPKEMVAPKVVAKGARLIAHKIVQIAREHNVAVIENKPLAQTLYKTVEIGQMIPLALYQAVADLLAYVWRIGKLKKRFF